MRSPNVANYIENSMLAHPNKLALIFDEQGQWTFKELDEMINQVANGLIDLGVKKGDRVSLFLPNSPEFLFFFFGIMKTSTAYPKWSARSNRNNFTKGRISGCIHAPPHIAGIGIL